MSDGKLVDLPTAHCSKWAEAGQFRLEKGGAKPIKIPDEILEVAKMAVARFGSFQPTLFVHGTKGRVFTTLPFGETNEERIAIMTQAGIQFAKSDRVGDCDDIRSRIKMVEVVFVGTLTSSLVHPRETFRRAIVEGAASIIIAHNHPSGWLSHQTRTRRSQSRCLKPGSCLESQCLTTSCLQIPGIAVFVKTGGGVLK